MRNFEETILSQYANSPTIVRLISNMNDYIDPAANLDAFYDLIWNVDTAQGYGLDVWGRIVGVSRVLALAGTPSVAFGFDEGAGWEPFGQGTFSTGPGATTNFPLSDDAFRTLILAKALSNISDGSIGSINQILINLFPGLGNCYCTDGGNMTMTYTFGSALTPVQLAIATETGVLPKPVGVSASVVQL